MRNTTCGSVAIALLLCGPAVSARQADTLPVSALPLRLMGVAKNTSAPARSAGLIQCGNPQEKRPAWFFRVGERACDIAEVREVRDDAIVIRNLAADRLELLILPKAGRAAVLPPSAPDAAVAAAEAEEIPAPSILKVSSDVVSIELRKELLQRYMANLPEVLSAALATPHYESAGVIEGYEMSRIKAGGIVEQLGIQEGDVLLEFNGQKLNSLAAVTSLFGQAQSLSGARMTVLRGGAKLTFVFTVK